MLNPCTTSSCSQAEKFEDNDSDSDNDGEGTGVIAAVCDGQSMIAAKNGKKRCVHSSSLA
jgi:hypothetical protein